MSETAGSVRVFADYDRDFRDEADVVVVGSGPTCGAVVGASSWRERVSSVVLLEEGPPFTPGEFELDGASRSMARTHAREAGCA